MNSEMVRVMRWPVSSKNWLIVLDDMGHIIWVLCEEKVETQYQYMSKIDFCYFENDELIQMYSNDSAASEMLLRSVFNTKS